MPEKYFPPKFKESAYNCPHCNVYSRIVWNKTGEMDSRRYYHEINYLHIATCNHCEKFSLWLNGEMIYPDFITVSPPNEDLQKTIKDDYEEAANIVNRSPRAAAALLRLALQKLCIQLGESGKNIDADIASLVKKGLNSKIQQSMDILRVIGNNAVHPGQIDLKDDHNTAIKLFSIINLIAQEMITAPKQIEDMYSTLPSAALKSIEKRNEK